MRCFFYALCGLVHVVAAFVIMANSRDYTFAAAQLVGAALYVGLGLWVGNRE